ncbi:MAG: hypothetical protein PVF97_05480 [Desulfobacterales bacterium]|jgi:hypothetical protein
MNYLLHGLMVLALIVFQTAVRPQIGLLTGIYDVLIAYILFLGLYRPLKESLAVVLISGFAMDSLSGGSFGLFLTTYFWAFTITRQLTHFLHPGNLVLRFFIVALGVVIQNGVYMGVATVLEDMTLAPASIKQTALTQLFWALGTGFILVTVFQQIHRKWDDILGTYFVRETA